VVCQKLPVGGGVAAVGVCRVKPGRSRTRVSRLLVEEGCGACGAIGSPLNSRLSLTQVAQQRSTHTQCTRVSLHI
jgi:hypothetical protein